MSGSTVQILLILFIFTLSSIPNTFATTLIEEACSGDVYVEMKPCTQLLQSDQKIASSTNLVDLLVAIFESGISNATKTLTYVEDMLKKEKLEPTLKDALTECKSSYISVIDLFNVALQGVKRNNYADASYLPLIACSNNINPCRDAIASKKIEDETILAGNEVVLIIGKSGVNVVNILQPQSTNVQESQPPPQQPAILE